MSHNHNAATTSTHSQINFEKLSSAGIIEEINTHPEGAIESICTLLLEKSDESLLHKLVEVLSSSPVNHEDEATVDRIVSALINVISKSTLSTSDPAAAVLHRFCLNNPRAVSSVVESMKSAHNNTEVVCRLANVIISCMGVSDEQFAICQSTHAIDGILQLSCTTDALLQLVSLDYLTGFALTKKGLAYICDKEKAVFLWLINLCTEAITPDSVTRIGALCVVGKIFSNGCHLDRGIDLAGHLHRDPRISQRMVAVCCENLQSSDTPCRVAATNCLAQFIHASASNLHDVMTSKPLLQVWLSPLLTAQVDTQVAILNSISCVLQSFVIISVDGDAPGKKAFFDVVLQYCDKLLPYCIQAAQRPFPDIKQAAYNILYSIASLPWGVAVLMSIQGFKEFILEMQMESTSEGKLAKYRVVKAVFENDVSRMMPADILAQFERVVVKGPHHVDACVAGPVAVER